MKKIAVCVAHLAVVAYRLALLRHGGGIVVLRSQAPMGDAVLFEFEGSTWNKQVQN